RRLCGKQIWRDIGVLVGRSRSFLGVRLIENAKRQQPQYRTGQTNGDLVAAAFERAPTQRRQNTHRAEPAHHVVDERIDRWIAWTRWRALERKQSRDCGPRFIESRAILPRARIAIGDDTRMDQPRLPRAERLRIEALALQVPGPPVGEKDVGTLE